MANLNIFSDGDPLNSYPLPVDAAPMFLKVNINGVQSPTLSFEEYYPVDGEFDHYATADCSGENDINIYSKSIDIIFLLPNGCPLEIENPEIQAQLELVTINNIGFISEYPQPNCEFTESSDIYCVLFPSCYFYGSEEPGGGEFNIYTTSFTKEICCGEIDFETSTRESEITIPPALKTAITPNPFNDQLRLTIALEKASAINIQIFDIMGRVVYEETKTMEAGNFLTNIPTEKLQKGTYLVSVQSEEGTNTHKLIKN